jgi:hypothetical protein
MVGSCFALVLGLLAWGCVGTTGNAVPFAAEKGQHPANWIQVHYAEYAKNPDQCRTCHGSTTDPTQAGGISKVSCFSCHKPGVNDINHPAGWANASQHGRMGAQLAPNTTNPWAMAGFARCAKCHGSTFNNGPAVSCQSCHTMAPHPNRPWVNNTSTTLPSHVQTNVANAPECAKCHLAGANSTMKPLTTPPSGTAPGCFNETLCHGTNIAR